MRVSILLRLTLAMTVLAVGVAAAVGYLAAEAAGQAVEQRLVHQLAGNAAALLGTRNLPVSDNLLRQLRQIIGAELVALDTAGRVLATSLPAEARQGLAKEIASGTSERVTIAGTTYRAGRQDVRRLDPLGTAPLRVTLVVLADPAQFEQARDRVTRRIRTIALIAALAAVALAAGLSLTITRPLRRLARRMDALARRAGDEAAPLPAAADAAQRRAGGPSEVVRLEKSFQHLLASLRQAREQLARTERLATLGKVAASVAHELRNPLSGIVMNLRVLRDELAAAKVSGEGLDLITAEAERMQLYLDEWMSLAREREPDTGSPPSCGSAGAGADGQGTRSSPSPKAQPAELADSVLALLAGRFRHAGVTVETEYLPTPPALAEPGQVRQVLMNLLLNALEVAPRGSIVRVRVRPGDHGRTRCEIADQGPGVSDSAGDIFDALVTTKPDGAGLGLYVCRRIVAALAGEIGYDNADSGAVFWFELPAGPADPVGTSGENSA